MKWNVFSQKKRNQATGIKCGEKKFSHTLLSKSRVIACDDKHRTG